MNTHLFELKKTKSDFESKKILTSYDSSEFIRQFYSDDIEIYESFFLLLLNKANKTVGYAKISQGGIAGTVVDIKIVGKYILDSLSSNIVICHNHPSGNLTPSEPDKRITEKIKAMCNMLDCCLIDHIILTNDSYFSFADNGIL